MKSILLVEPTRFSWTWKTYPLGLLTLNAFLHLNKVNSKYVRMFDTLRKEGYSLDKIGSLKPGVLAEIVFSALEKDILKHEAIGISVTFRSSFDLVVSFSKLVKTKFPKKKIIIGGGYLTSMYLNDFLTKDYFENCFDFAILFDGEQSLYSLLKRNFEKIGDIPNLIFVRDNVLQVNKFKNDLDMDKLPLVRNLYDSDEHNSGHRVFLYETGRGCYWHKCSFCIYKKGFYRYREKSAKKIVSDLKLLEKDIKGKTLRFITDCMSIKQASDISNELIKNRMFTPWFVWMRFEKGLSYEILKHMNESGCFMIQFGLESGDPKINNGILNKGIDLKDAERILEDCNNLGIRTIIFAITGIPGETLLSALKTTRFITRNKKNISELCLFPFGLFKSNGSFSSPITENISIIKKKSGEDYSFTPRKGFFYKTFLLSPFIILNCFYFSMFTKIKTLNMIYYNLEWSNKSFLFFIKLLDRMIPYQKKSSFKY